MDALLQSHHRKNHFQDERHIERGVFFSLDVASRFLYTLANSSSSSLTRFNTGLRFIFAGGKSHW